MKRIRIGAGAGYSGDRIEPAVELAEKGELDYLVFECLAERTIALAQQAKAPRPGARLRPAAGGAHARRCSAAASRAARAIVTNMGAANPGGGAPRRCARSPARSASPGCAIAVVTGDDVLSTLVGTTLALEDDGHDARGARRPPRSPPTPTSARSRSSRRSRRGADVVITGRAADPSLFLAPIVARVRLVDGRLDAGSARARSSATCSSAPGRSPAATSPIPVCKDVAGPRPARLPDRRGATRTARRDHQGRRARAGG